MTSHPPRQRMITLVQGMSTAGRELLRHAYECPRCGEVFAELLQGSGSKLFEPETRVLPWRLELGMEDGWSGRAAGSGRHEPGCTAAETTEPATAGRSPVEGVDPGAADHDERALSCLRELGDDQIEFALLEAGQPTWGLVERALLKSRQLRYEDPHLAEKVALLAVELAQRIDRQRYGLRLPMDLKARAWLYVSVARRLAADLIEAQEACRLARECLTQGTGDILEQALLLEVEGSLHKDLRSFEEGSRMLKSAASLFSLIGDQVAAGRSLMNLANLLQQAGNLPGAIETLRQAVEQIGSEQDPILTLALQHNLATCLIDAGQYEQAQRLIDQQSHLYHQHADNEIDQRRRWLQAQIHRGQGRVEEAEAGFLDVREGFIAAGMGYDAALVSLELATLYAEQSRFCEMRRLADEMLPIFRAQDIHREALAALAIFQQAARMEGVTLRLARDLTDYLGKARFQPYLRFEAQR